MVWTTCPVDGGWLGGKGGGGGTGFGVCEHLRTIMPTMGAARGSVSDEGLLER